MRSNFNKDEKKSMYLTSPSNGGRCTNSTISHGPILYHRMDEGGINVLDMSTDRLAFAKNIPANPSELFISTTAYTISDKYPTSTLLAKKMSLTALRSYLK